MLDCTTASRIRFDSIATDSLLAFVIRDEFVCFIDVIICATSLCFKSIKSDNRKQIAMFLIMIEDCRRYPTECIRKNADRKNYSDEGTGCEEVPVMASKIYPERLQQSPKNIESECMRVLRNTRNKVD